jgi:hypothetical protein
MPPELVAADARLIAEKEHITRSARFIKRNDRENIKFTSATRYRACAPLTIKLESETL